MKLRIILTLSVAIALFVGTFALALETVAAKTNCFTETNQTNQVVWLPICDYNGLRDSGYAMGSLPATLDPSKCYFWGADATSVGREVNCSQQEYANAQPLNSSAPPAVNLDDAIQSNNLAQSTEIPVVTDEDRAAIVNCDGTDAAGQQECLRNNPIMGWIRVAVNFLSAGAGVVITIMIIVGGIQYAGAGSNPQAVLAAKKKITSALIALVALAFIYSFLQWLVPGGIF